MKILDYRLGRKRAVFRSAPLALILLPMLLVACATPGAPPKSGTTSAPKAAVAPLAKVTGDLTYRQPFALTPDAVVTVQLTDVSRQDTTAVVLAEQIITRPGQVPIPFELDYDPDSIKPAHRYAVQARIEERGKLLYRNDTVRFVLTHGNPNTVELLLVPVR